MSVCVCIYVCMCICRERDRERRERVGVTVQAILSNTSTLLTDTNKLCKRSRAAFDSTVAFQRCL